MELTNHQNVIQKRRQKPCRLLSDKINMLQPFGREVLNGRGMMRLCSSLQMDLPILKQYCSKSNKLSPGAKDKWIYKTKPRQAEQLFAITVCSIL